MHFINSFNVAVFAFGLIDLNRNKHNRHLSCYLYFDLDYTLHRHSFDSKILSI